MTYTSYNSLLELCYCMDEFALPQPGEDEIGQPLESLESSEDNSDHSAENRQDMLGLLLQRQLCAS